MRSAITALFTLVLTVTLGPLALMAPAVAAGRVALVVGNAQYQHVPRLANAQNDAGAIAAMLRNEDFAVEEHQNLSNAALRLVMRNFVTKTRDADVAVVYYAGHGIEVGGINYLIPVDAKLATDLDAQDEALSLDRVLQVLDPARRLRLVILDACRDNPFVAGMKRTVATRAVARGLAQVEPSRPNTLIAFAAKAGSVADDGDAGHSPFTQALLAHLAEPGLDIRLALGRVRDDVVEKTRSGQEPFVYGSLGGSIVTLSAKTVPDATKLGNVASDDFGIAQRLGTVEGWDAFLARHSDGLAAELARKERERLAARTKEPPTGTPAAAATTETGATARIGDAFGPDDRARVKEIATRNQLPLPDYQIVTPAADLDPSLRKFVGVWASRIGYNEGKGRQTMVITTGVEKDGRLRGISLGGPPTPGSPNQNAAYAIPFTGRATANRFVFYDGVSLQRLELARDGRLQLSTSAPSGTFKAELEPIWLAADPAADTAMAALPQHEARVSPRFDQAARAQVSAIATRHQLPLPNFSLDGADNIAERWRKFAGVWASTNGFNGGPVQAMVIIHAIGDLGDVDGHYLIGASRRDQLPARSRPLHGIISDNKLTFATGRARIDATWTPGNLLQLRAVQNTGNVSMIDLRPVWTAAAGLRSAALPVSAPVAAPRNVPQRSRPAGPAPGAPDSGMERRGGGGGRGRGGGGDAIFDHPRFSSCARTASQRGMMGPGSGRRQFIRTCVYG